MRYNKHLEKNEYKSISLQELMFYLHDSREVYIVNQDGSYTAISTIDVPTNWTSIGTLFTKSKLVVKKQRKICKK